MERTRKLETWKSCKTIVIEPDLAAWISCINNGFLTVSKWQSNPFQPTSRLKWSPKPFRTGQTPLQNSLADVTPDSRRSERVCRDSKQPNKPNDQFINAYNTGTPAELEEVCVFHMERERQHERDRKHKSREVLRGLNYTIKLLSCRRHCLSLQVKSLMIRVISLEHIKNKMQASNNYHSLKQWYSNDGPSDIIVPFFSFYRLKWRSASKQQSGSQHKCSGLFMVMIFRSKLTCGVFRRFFPIHLALGY